MQNRAPQGRQPAGAPTWLAVGKRASWGAVRSVTSFRPSPSPPPLLSPPLSKASGVVRPAQAPPGEIDRGRAAAAGAAVLDCRCGGAPGRRAVCRRGCSLGSLGRAAARLKCRLRCRNGSPSASPPAVVIAASSSDSKVTAGAESGGEAMLVASLPTCCVLPPPSASLTRMASGPDCCSCWWCGPLVRGMPIA